MVPAGSQALGSVFPGLLSGFAAFAPAPSTLPPGACAVSPALPTWEQGQVVPSLPLPSAPKHLPDQRCTGAACGPHPHPRPLHLASRPHTAFSLRCS